MRSRGLEPPRDKLPLGPQPSASAIPPRPHKKIIKYNYGADGGSRTLMGSRPPASRAGASAVSPHPQKIGRDGRTCTSAARMGVAFTARCNCCSATSRKSGLGRDSHPRPSPYEGAALTAAPPSREWWKIDRPGGEAPGRGIGSFSESPGGSDS